MNLRIALVILFASAPSQAQSPLIEPPQWVTYEERMRINKEFADLFEQKTLVEQKLYDCRSVQLVSWQGWW